MAVPEWRREKLRTSAARKSSNRENSTRPNPRHPLPARWIREAAENPEMKSRYLAMGSEGRLRNGTSEMAVSGMAGRRERTTRARSGTASRSRPLARGTTRAMDFQGPYLR